MKNYLFINFLWIACIMLSPEVLRSQETQEVPDEKKAIVVLKSGSKVEGEIVEWIFDESITLRFAWGGTTRFDQHRIKKIIQKSASVKTSSPYNFKETGLYYSARLNVITGNAGRRANGSYGMGASFSSGWRFNRFLSLGGGVAYDKYIFDTAENLMPVFAEVTGFLNASNISMFYNIQSGYAFAFTDEDYLLIDAKGGLMVYPSFGLRWGNDENLKYTLSVGYKFQNAEFTYADPWNALDRREQDLQFKRFTVGFGILW